MGANHAANRRRISTTSLRQVVTERHQKFAAIPGSPTSTSVTTSTLATDWPGSTGTPPRLRSACSCARSHLQHLQPLIRPSRRRCMQRPQPVERMGPGRSRGLRATPTLPRHAAAFGQPLASGESESLWVLYTQTDDQFSKRWSSVAGSFFESQIILELMLTKFSRLPSASAGPLF